MIDIPGFPATPWTGSTPNRSNLLVDKNPDHTDWDKLMAEFLAIQNDYLLLQDALGNTNLAKNAIIPGTDGPAVTINNLFTIVSKDIVLPIGGSAVASVALGYSIPANSILLACAANIQSAITLATAVKIGIGDGSAPSTYGLITGGAKNAKCTNPFVSLFTTTDALGVYACATDGTAAGTIANGSIRVRLVIATQTALPNN